MAISKTSSSSPSVQKNETHRTELVRPQQQQQQVSQPKADKPSTVARQFQVDSFTPAKASTNAVALNAASAPQAAAKAGTVDPHGFASEATSGAEAAARLKNEDNYATANWELHRGEDFMKTVEAHKNDPAFMKEMYQELGPQLTAKLLADGQRGTEGRYATEAESKAAYQAAAQSLNHMPASFQRQVGLEAGKNHPEAAMVLKHGASQTTKLAFLEGVKATATGNGYDANYAARMAGEVIASDPALLKHVADTWSSAEVTNLFKNGLETPPISNSSNPDWPSLTPDGLERMVGMTANLKDPKYADFRARVFRDAATGLGNTGAGDPNRQSLVDNLKTLFKSDSQGIVSKLFNNAGPNSPFDSSQKALGLFFRDAVFANPNKDDPFTQYVSDFMGNLRGQMLDPARIDNNPATASNELIAKQLGDVLGSLVTGYSMAAKQNGESQKAREAMATTIVGLLAKPFEVGGGVVGSMAKDEAQKLASSLLGNFLNGDLRANKEGMTKLMDTLLQTAYAGSRDFDERYGTNVENSVKTETLWVDFIRQLFDR